MKQLIYLMFIGTLLTVHNATSGFNVTSLINQFQSYNSAECSIMWAGLSSVMLMYDYHFDYKKLVKTVPKYTSTSYDPSSKTDEENLQEALERSKLRVQETEQIYEAEEEQKIEESSVSSVSWHDYVSDKNNRILFLCAYGPAACGLGWYCVKNYLLKW